MYQRAALHTTMANTTRYGGARRISIMCSPLSALRQTALPARGTLQRRPRADNCSRLAPPMLWTSSGQDTHAAGSVDCAAFEKFCIAKRAIRNQKRTQFRVRTLVQPRSSLHHKRPRIQCQNLYHICVRNLVASGRKMDSVWTPESVPNACTDSVSQPWRMLGF